MTPTAVPELPGARQIAAGRWHTCAVLNDGRVRCAGRNDDGQLGLGAISTDRCSAPPDLFPCARMFSDVMLPASEEATVGNYHSCARLADGAVRCWGAGYYGQTGDGTTTSRPGPVATSNLP
jgi:alpha-tubulin suppressor-like RCC1 family protein